MATTNNDSEQMKRLFAGVQFYVEISRGLNKEEAETVSGAPPGLTDHQLTSCRVAFEAPGREWGSPIPTIRCSERASYEEDYAHYLHNF